MDYELKCGLGRWNFPSLFLPSWLVYNRCRIRHNEKKYDVTMYTGNEISQSYYSAVRCVLCCNNLIYLKKIDIFKMGDYNLVL